MIYRTVTVTPELSTDNITVTGELADNAVTVTAAVSGNITADAELTNNIVTATAEVSGNVTADARIITKLQHGEYEDYTGSYQVTPSQQTQTLQTSGKVLIQNIVVNPIPSNYGLITWNGATLTVS